MNKVFISTRESTCDEYGEDLGSIGRQKIVSNFIFDQQRKTKYNVTIIYYIVYGDRYGQGIIIISENAGGVGGTIRKACQGNRPVKILSGDHGNRRIRCHSGMAGSCHPRRYCRISHLDLSQSAAKQVMKHPPQSWPLAVFYLWLSLALQTQFSYMFWNGFKGND